MRCAMQTRSEPALDGSEELNRSDKRFGDYAVAFLDKEDNVYSEVAATRELWPIPSL